MSAPNWRLEGACRYEDPDLFFAADGETPDVRYVREAKAKGICGGCIVRTPCLDFRLGFERQRDGDIWAGFDGEQRTALRHAWLKRQQRRAA